MQTPFKLPSNRLEWIIAAVLGLAVFVAFTFWGGIPTDERFNTFMFFVVLLIAFSAIFVGVTWHLLFRPLPAGHKVVSGNALSIPARQFLSLLLAIGGLCLVVGPFWDEIWHRRYGIPFGQDFFWRPHMLLYFGLGSGVFLGFWGLSRIMFGQKGSFQQRMRANPLIGLIIVSSAFLMYVVPADPVWHIVYGRDLSAWSIPHILLLIGIAVIMLMSLVVHMSTVPARVWDGIHKFNLDDILPILMFAGIMMPWLQILMIDWDQTQINPLRLEGRFRPDWLMAANIVFTSSFVGLIANRSLRKVGAATLTGLTALGLRIGMIQIFGVGDTMSFDAWVLALLPLVAIDVWMGYRILVAKADASWYTTGIAAAIGVAIAAPLLYNYYPVLAANSNIFVLMFAGLVASLGGSWLGTQVGEYAGVQNKQLEEGKEKAPAFSSFASMGTLVFFLVFVIFFINTATPPIPPA